MAAATGKAPHMGVVIFRLENNYKATDEVILDKFSWLSSIVQDYSTYRDTFYTIREDQTRVLQITGWNSVEQHYEGFHSSPDIAGVLAEFGGILDVRSSWHAEIPYFSIKLDAPLITLCRFFVPARNRTKFESLLPSVEPKSSATAGRNLLLAWRIEGAGWNDQDHNINHLNDYRSPDQANATQTDSQQSTASTEIHEFNAVIPWASLELWEKAAKEGQEMQPFSELLEHVDRLEVWHLEPLKVPEYEESEEEDDDEDDEDEDDE